MGEKFNTELNKVQAIKSYNKTKQRLLDDMATAYISNSFNGLDESLIAVKSIRKALRANGYTAQQIDDFLVEYSYITKSQIRRYYNQSIYNEDCSIKSNVAQVVANHSDRTTTDLIIDELQKRPALLKALQKGMRADQIQRDFKINNTTLLKNFYEQHKDIINN